MVEFLCPQVIHRQGFLSLFSNFSLLKYWLRVNMNSVMFYFYLFGLVEKIGTCLLQFSVVGLVRASYFLGLSKWAEPLGPSRLSTKNRQVGQKN